MRILLRNVNTRLYLDSVDWIEDIGHACEFKSGGDAIMFAAEHHLGDVEIIYAFSNPEYNFRTGMLGLCHKTGGSAVAPGKFSLRAL